MGKLFWAQGPCILRQWKMPLLVQGLELDER